jgi:hypothetical protein
VHAQERPPATDSVEVVLDDTADSSIILQRVDLSTADIVIDGHVDAAIWREQPVLGEFLVVEPDTLVAPSYTTEMRIFYTERGLYTAFDMEQPPETLVQRHAPRDSFDVNRDTIGLNIDSSGAGRYGYWITLALGDGQMDGTVLPERQYGRDWDGAWYGATQRTPRGWSAEFFMPWSQMAMPKEDGVRRLNLYFSRKVAHLNERWGWPALPRSQPRFMSLWQAMQVDGIDPHQQWSVFPYASTTFNRVGDDRTRAGLDLFWRPSSNFQGTATLNPDFGSVESDNVDVNLTSEETFFPEKRLFFQEGQEVFTTSGRANAGGPQRLTVVNTRRIGGRPATPDLPPGVGLPRRESLRPADLFGAVKATGQIGRFRYGLLAASEDDTDLTADDGNVYTETGRDFGAVRVVYEDNANATYRGLGFVSTLVDHADADAVVHAADFNLLSQSGKWNFEGQYLYSDRDESGDGTGATLDIEYAPRQGQIHKLALSDFGPGLNVNDLGFQVRDDLQFVNYMGEWIKSGLTRIRDLKLTGWYAWGRNDAGQEIRGGIGTNFEFSRNNNDKVHLSAAWFPSRWEDRESFGNGTFQINERSRFEASYESDTSRPLSVAVKLDYDGSDLYGGALRKRVGLTWQPRDDLNMTFGVAHTDLDGWLLHQENQNFTTFKGNRWQPDLAVDFYPTAKQQLRVVLQWVGIEAIEDRFYTLQSDPGQLIVGSKPVGPSDDFSISTLNFQVRYRWQIAPLSDLFIVYTKGDSRRIGRDSFSDIFQDSWQDPLADQLVIKLRYRLGS